MDYFLLNLCPTEDVSLCILEGSPDGASLLASKMATGRSIAGRYPANPSWPMGKSFPGMKVASLVASTAGLLVVARPLFDVLSATGVAMESYPFTLLDHKKRVASRDHLIVNPLGTLDCLNLKKSSIEYSPDDPDEVVDLETPVLDPRKVAAAPPLFRIKENPRAVVLSHELVDKLRPLNPSNLYLIKIEQSA